MGRDSNLAEGTSICSNNLANHVPVTKIASLGAAQWRLHTLLKKILKEQWALFKRK